MNDSAEIVDLEAAAQRVPGGSDGVRRLAKVFLIECADLMESLHQSIPDGDPVEVSRTAHSLKGASKLFHAHRVHDAAFAIETQAKNGDLLGAVDKLQTLSSETDQLVHVLNEFLQQDG